MSDTNWVPIGHIIKPHGLKGELKVALHSAVSLLEQEIQLQGHLYRVVAERNNNKYILLYLEGITDIDAAEPLRGESIFVREDLLPDGDYYVDSLKGLTVIDADTQKRIGVLVDLDNLAAHPVLRIKLDAGIGEAETILMPFVWGEYVQQVLLSEGRLLLRGWQYFL